MSIFLESIELTGLILDENFDNKIDSVFETSSMGTGIVFEKKRMFSAFDLIGGEKFGWLMRNTMNELKVLASALNSVYILNHEGVLYNVRWRNEDIPVIDASPIIRRSNFELDDYYNNVVLKFMEV